MGDSRTMTTLLRTVSVLALLLCFTIPAIAEVDETDQPFDEGYDEDEEDIYPEDLVGPGVPAVKKDEPEHYDEGRKGWWKADKNKDGKLVLEELQGYFFKEFYGPDGVMNTGVEATNKARANEDGAGLLKELDTNKDKELNFEEFAAQYKDNDTQNAEEEDAEDEKEAKEAEDKKIAESSDKKEL